MSWDKFLDDAEAASGSHYQKCGVAVFFETLDAKARKSINEAFKRPELTTSAIVAAIKQRTETKVSEYTFRRHRQGKCSCPKNG